MAIKPLYILYQAKNNTTGLTDVKAQVYFNGTAALTNSTAVLLTELDSTNSPGLYQLMITAAQLATMGVATGQVNTVEGYINSVTAPARAPFREEVQVFDSDDNSVKLGTPAGASVSADILTANTAIAAVKVDLETGTNSLANILAAIAAIQNNAGFSIPVPPQLIIPGSSSNPYLIPITIYNEQNVLVDPASNLITVGVVNQAGTDRGANLTGSSGSPATVAATRVSTGQYTVALTVPSSAVQEEWIFSFAYSIGANATVRKATTTLVTAVTADGFALQSTLLSTQTTVGANNTLLSNGTYGLAALQTGQAAIQTTANANNTLLSNGTYGLSALQTLEAANNTLLTSGTYGLNALLTAINNIGTGGRAV